MVYYRLCVSVKLTDKGTRFAYAFYNQHDFCVYKKTGLSELLVEEDAYINVCSSALRYFTTHIRTRYYTEHFSELLDEDGGIVLCPYSEIADAFKMYREGRDMLKKDRYAPLYEHFDVRSISFVYEACHPLQKRTSELLDI